MNALLPVLLGFTLGAMGWSFAEYALHNWVGHLSRGRTRFSREHLQHHAERLYFTPTRTKLLLALPKLGVLAALAVWGLGWAAGSSLWVGFASAYLGYELLHRRLHTHPPRGPYGRWARKHHFYHHFHGPHQNHGVSSPLWDLVFGTYTPVERVRVPERMAMRWLLDPETGEVRAELVEDYELARRRRSAPAR